MNQGETWEKFLNTFDVDQVENELRFWLEKIKHLNSRHLAAYSYSSIVIFSDASERAAGAFTVEVYTKIFHKMWSETKKF